MARVYVGLGSNVDAQKNLRLCVHELRYRFGDLALSKVYQSVASGFAGADFLNLVVGLDTDCSPARLHSHIEDIHEMAGRHRGERKFSSRSLDIDLLLYDDLVLNEPPLKLPRADVLEHNFVLRPLAELAPDLVHPLTGQTIAAHWQAFNDAGHPLTVIDVIL